MNRNRNRLIDIETRLVVGKGEVGWVGLESVIQSEVSQKEKTNTIR